MNRLYLDSGVLVKLYVAESGSREVQKAIESVTRLYLNQLQEAELRNALWAAGGRGQLEARAVDRVIGFIDEDFRKGRLISREVLWDRAWKRAIDFAANYTRDVLCRTLDILHVAIAVEQKAEIMITGDRRQAELCKRVGLPMTWIE